MKEKLSCLKLLFAGLKILYPVGSLRNPHKYSEVRRQLAKMLSGRELELWIFSILETLFIYYPKIRLMLSGGIPTNQKIDKHMCSFPHSSFSGGVVTGIKCLVYSWNLLMIRPQKRVGVDRLERNESGLTLRNGVLREGGKFKGWFGNQ